MENPNKKVLPNILITGTPGTGKTTLSSILTHQLNEFLASIDISETIRFKHLEVSKIVNENKLYSNIDENLDCTVFDEDKLLDFLEPHVPAGGYIVDFHSNSFFPERYFNFVFVMKTANTVLYDRLKAREYSELKIKNNVECEIFQECYNDAMESYRSDIVWTFTNNVETDMNGIINQIYSIFKEKGVFNHFKQ